MLTLKRWQTKPSRSRTLHRRCSSFPRSHKPSKRINPPRVLVPPEHQVSLPIPPTNLHSPFVGEAEASEAEAEAEAPEGEALPTSNPPQSLAGNLSRYVQNWSTITNNNFLLRILREGYKIQFLPNPTFPKSVISSPACPVKRKALSDQIKEYLLIGAISKVPPNDKQILSRVFTVKKANGRNRMILDLSLINTQIHKVSFKMETYEHIFEILQPNDYLGSIDLRDAFFTTGLHKDSKDFCCFEFESQRYQFEVLPFGMTSSPRIFSKILRPVITHLRSSGVRILSYLDDIFICASSYALLKEHIKICLDLLISLGYSPNYEKSSLNPSHELLHLGFLWNSSSMTVSVPTEKTRKTQNFASRLLSSSPTLRELSSFVGLLVSLRPAFSLAPLHYRQLQLQQCSLIKKGFDWDFKVSLNPDSVADITWWATCPSPLPSVSLRNFQSKLTLFTDSSKTGWGGVLSSGESVRGTWSSTESSYHINVLELKAIEFSLRSFIHLIANSSVSVMSDNITSVFYMNKIGGTHSKPLCLLTLDIWRLLSQHNISCKAFHIPGIDNSHADFYSRCSELNNDYSISTSAFSAVLSLISFKPTLDLFASRLTHKLESYVSYKFDPFSERTDAFSFPWPNEVYLFPPINLIGRCVQKIMEENVNNALIITPAWPGLVSLPTITSLLIEPPVLIDSIHLEGQPPTRHPFSMMAWPTSTNLQKRKEYAMKLLPISFEALQRQPFRLIADIGNNLARSLLKKGHKVAFLQI